MRSKEELRLAVDMLHLLNRDQEVVDIAFKELMADNDRNSFFSYVEKIATERGMQKVVIKMLAKGMDIKFIEEITGLTEEQILKIVS